MNEHLRTGLPLLDEALDTIGRDIKEVAPKLRPKTGQARAPRGGQTASQKTAPVVDKRWTLLDVHLVATVGVLVGAVILRALDKSGQAFAVAGGWGAYLIVLPYLLVTRRARRDEIAQVALVSVRALKTDPRFIAPKNNKWRFRRLLLTDAYRGRVHFADHDVLNDRAAQKRVADAFWLAFHARVTFPETAKKPYFDWEETGRQAEPAAIPDEEPAAHDDTHAEVCVKIEDGLREDWKVGPKLSLTVRVDAVDELGPVAFVVEYPSKVKDQSDDVRLALVDKVAAKAGHRWTGDWDTENNRVVVRRRPPLPDRIENPMGSADDPGQGLPWHVIPFGVAEGGGLACLDFKKEPHALISGRTRRGKTVVARTIMLRSAANGLRVLGIDPKQVEFDGYQAIEGIEVYDEDEANIAAVEALHAEMKRRYSKKRQRIARLDSHQPIVAVVDEYQEFVEVANRIWKAEGNKGEHPVIDDAQSIVRLGAAANIFLIFLTQRSDASWFSGLLRENLGWRAGVGRLSAEASRMLGLRGRGQDVPGIKGRTTYLGPDGEIEEAQAYWTPNPGAEDLTDADRALLDRLMAWCKKRKPWPKPEANSAAADAPVDTGPTIVDIDELNLMLDDQDRIDVIDCESLEELTVVAVDEPNLITYLLEDGTKAAIGVDDNARFELRGESS